MKNNTQRDLSLYFTDRDYLYQNNNVKANISTMIFLGKYRYKMFVCSISVIFPRGWGYTRSCVAWQMYMGYLLHIDISSTNLSGRSWVGPQWSVVSSP